MAATPRKYEWEGYEVVTSASPQATGAALHYYTGIDGQILFVDGDGQIASQRLEIIDGHWQDMRPIGTAQKLSPATENYGVVNFNHPSTGTVYGVGIDNETICWPRLFYYDYMKDVSAIVESGTWRMQLDNPISQIDLSLKNINEALFTDDTSLFIPGGRVELGLRMGDSSKLPIGVAYIDEIDYTYNAQLASISGRNIIGFKLNDIKIPSKGAFTGTVEEILEIIFNLFGVEHYIIEEREGNVKLEYDIGMTGVEILQKLSDLISDGTEGNNWEHEVMPDGTIVCGYDEFRSEYLPKGYYTFDGKGDLFQRRLSRSLDGVYKYLRVRGEDENGNALTPEQRSIDTWDYWEPGDRYYIPDVLKGVTQQELSDYADNLKEQLRLVGKSESYSGPIRPQLLVGDVAVIGSQAVGSITEITHSFGERGYTTDFTVTSGGQWTDETGGKVYTNNRDVKGNSRKKRISDFIK